MILEQTPSKPPLKNAVKPVAYFIYWLVSKGKESSIYPASLVGKTQENQIVDEGKYIEIFQLVSESITIL